MGEYIATSRLVSTTKYTPKKDVKLCSVPTVFSLIIVQLPYKCD